MQELSITAAAEQNPEAVCWVEDGREWSFEDARLAARRMIHRFSLRPLAELDRSHRGLCVAVKGTQSASQLVALFALLELEIPFVVLHPRWSASETAEVMARCGVQLVLGSGSLAEAVSQPAPGPGMATHREPEANSAEHLDATQVVVFTSGTQSSPKGVRLSRRALVASARASEERLGWSRDDRWLLSLPLAHVGGLSVVIRALCARGTVVIDEGPRFNAQAFVSKIEASEVTMVSLVPTMLQRIVRDSVGCPKSLRFALIGGARAPLPLLEQAFSLGWPCLTTYGLTEAGSQVATQKPGTVAGLESGVGPPLRGIEVRIRDEEWAGEMEGGRVEVRGPVMFSGYLGEPSRKLDDWFSTGDRGRLDENGNLHILDRCDGVLISGGENVVPAQIEAAIEEHPEVQASCVVGLEDSEWGQRLAAVVQRVDGLQRAPRDFEGFLQHELATYKRPRRLRFVCRLPETAAGKLDRRACEAMFQADE